MTDYIATFHTYFSALQSYQQLTAKGIEASLAPVPRALSADCGTCVRYCADAPQMALLHRDFDRVVLAANLETVAENEE